MEMTMTFKCWIKEGPFKFKFAKEVSRKFTLSEPAWINEGFIYEGPESEIRRLELFYNGMVFFYDNRVLKGGL